MLVFNVVLSSKFNEILFLIQNECKKSLEKEGFFNMSNDSFSFLFPLNENTEIELRFTDEFSFTLLEYKNSDGVFETIASFGEKFPDNLEIDIKFLNKDFIDYFNFKIHSLLHI